MRAIQHLWVSRYIRATARRFDRQFHVDTSGWIEGKDLDGGENTRHATAYDGVLPNPFRDVMGQIGIDFARYCFADFGSGKGRAVLLASEYPFAKIIGVEFSPRLHESARINCSTYRSPAQACRVIELHCADATQFVLPEVPTVIFLFNPFREEIMRPVAERVQASFRKCPRRIFVVYFWPVARSAWDRLEEFKAVPIRQPRWAWPAHRGREIVAVWTAKASNGPHASADST